MIFPLKLIRANPWLILPFTWCPMLTSFRWTLTWDYRDTGLDAHHSHHAPPKLAEYR
jgi:hypothetical protein